MGCHSPGAGDRMFLRTVSAGDGTDWRGVVQPARFENQSLSIEARRFGNFPSIQRLAAGSA